MITVFITGSNGSIGKEIYASLSKKRNITLIPIIRYSKKNYGNYILWDYFNKKKPHKVKADKFVIKSSYLIHCAYNFNDKKLINNSNYTALENIYSYLKGVKIINISTMSAYNGCKSIYGQNKLNIEKYIESNYGYNLRMGVPINAVNNKSIGFLSAQKKINNLLPFFTFAINTKSDGLIYLSYLPNFNRVIYKIICSQIPSGTFSIVRIKPIKLIDFIATYTNKFIIKIDWRLIYLLLKFIEVLGLNLRFGSDSVIGLVKATRHLEKPLLK